MKVALFLGRRTPIHSGGSYSFERDLLCALAEFKECSHHEFFVYGWSKDIPIELLGATHIHFIENLNYPKFISILYNLLFGKDSIILKNLLSHQIEITWCLGLDCPTMEIPYIATVWDLQHRVQPYYPEVSQGRNWLLREEFYATALRRATFIVTGTSAGKSEVEKLYNIPSERIKILPFATPRFALEAGSCNQNQGIKGLAKYNIIGEYLFYPAQLWPHKNHIGLLLAVKELKEQYNLYFSVIFAGSNKGNYRFLRQKVDELELSQQVHFLGFIDREDLILLYQHAFAMTYITFAGPDNLPPLEAFALGCPVIASRVSGAQEQLGDAALLIDPKEPQQIVLAVKSLKENLNLRQTLIHKGLVRAAAWKGQDYLRGVCSILDEFAAVRRCWSSTEPYNEQLL